MGKRTGKESKRKAQRFPRTRAGCLTCKQRHLKCDQTPGMCLQFQKGQVKCDGYAPPKAWIFESKAGLEAENGRQTLQLRLRQLLEGSSAPYWLPPVCGSAVDPFQVAPVLLEQETTILLQFYVRVLEPTVSGLWHPGKQLPTTTLHDCFHNELRMQGLLSETAAYMEHAANIGGSRGRTAIHVHRCTQAIQIYIQNNGTPSSALVFAVLHLCGAEDMRNNLDASMIHLRGARDIVSSLGGLNALDENTRQILIGIDGYRAVQLMQEPLLPCVFDPGNAVEYLGHLSGLLEHLRMASSVGTSLYGRNDGINSLRPTIEMLAEALRVWQYAWLNKLEDPRPWYWLVLRFQSIRHRMLSIKRLSPRDRVLRAALVIWNTMLRSIWGSQKIVKSAVPHLRRRIECCEDLGLLSTVTRQWILSVGAMAAEHTADEQWFKAQLQCLLDSDSPVQYYEKLKTISKGCFYLEPLEDERLWKLCNSISKPDIASCITS